MKLWIDDKRLPPDDSWTWAKTSEEATRLFHENKVVEISFDHDLGGDDNPVRLADEIEEKAFWDELPRLKWNVHSGNPPGRDRIKRALERADERWEINEFAHACHLAEHAQ